MGKLNPQTTQTIWDLQRQLLEIIDSAKTLELSLFESFGETERTINYLDELQSIAEQATDRFTRFSTFQIRIANTQPPVSSDIIELVARVIENTQQKIPALERSIQEIRQEWRLS
ncbi:hypothetical protein [Chamaesiphon polymorphus]|uniref:Uncharacterized protein n=1 Tax=Chamaesiphon polymorphus CCALA 037 TaxID=2107692 RepID=A0A2T1GHR6_9CYAN|nr:hypothetical protein [Chamaesiphon polymorphus]PSB57145.1 hypothetical protein C7B77_09400 [Chamaesiphon polymorphus CCALA 037]